MEKREPKLNGRSGQQQQNNQFNQFQQNQPPKFIQQGPSQISSSSKTKQTSGSNGVKNRMNSKEIQQHQQQQFLQQQQDQLKYYEQQQRQIALQQQQLQQQQQYKHQQQQIPAPRIHGLQQLTQQVIQPKAGSQKSQDNSPFKNSGTGAAFVKENYGNIKDFYKISSCIGRGAYGEVRKCLHKETKALRAVKIINKKCLAEDEKQKLLNEIDILKQLDHPNILKLYEFFQDQKRYFLVTELCNGGELFDKIAEEQYFSEQDAAKIIKQILSAINYCHQKSIVHRDLKPENLLMNRDVSDPKITIIDFGTSGLFDPGEKMKQKFGTPYYIAPEVLNNNYDEKCDLWSIGVILYILLCGYPPFNGSNDEQIIKKVKEGKYRTDEEEWQNISKDAIDIITKLLQYEPGNRISASEALQHKWIKDQSKIEIDKDICHKTLSNLKNFSGTSKLQQCALAFIASHLTQDEEKRDLDKIFKAIDIDGDGNLTKEEVILGYEQHFGIPITEEQVDEMFERIDLDGNGTIDYTEFVMATINEKNLVTNERLLQAFKMFDKDNSGALSYDEIKEVLCFDSQVDELSVQKIIEEVDENGNGEIEFDEFCNMMKKLSVSHQ